MDVKKRAVQTARWRLAPKKLLFVFFFRLPHESFVCCGCQERWVHFVLSDEQSISGHWPDRPLFSSAFIGPVNSSRVPSVKPAIAPDFVFSLDGDDERRRRGCLQPTGASIFHALTVSIFTFVSSRSAQTTSRMLFFFRLATRYHIFRATLPTATIWISKSASVCALMSFVFAVEKLRCFTLKPARTACVSERVPSARWVEHLLFVWRSPLDT